ncbi:thioredoxin domain-containing protein [Polaribacter sp. SA4-10]|nr:thioredoxin domain-containing protein [Polaribacter sp. SA4-10]ARV08018.1 thioredoxin domain-containing protein [Polaribacter sp. SA4-10]
MLFIINSCSKKKSLNDKKSNALIHETSPYLLQHAYNPVNWKAWNTKTLELAKKENKLLVISVGYSACHWCHVMEEESFENDSIAKIMNDNFINIKVDREERPDVDKVYMNAVQLMTGSGGWPLNCIALPDGRPIFGGTYFTKEQWSKVLTSISKLYNEEPEKAIKFAENLTKGIQESELITLNKEVPSFSDKEVSLSIEVWKEQIDTVFGGFKGAPKFPMPNSLEFLLRYSHQFNDKKIEDYLNTTLTKIAYGGIYDHVSGGFSRYSVDEKWHIPHFEKMLYDNAQLVSLYSKAYLKNKNELYKNIVFETLNFIKEELTAKNGAFYSSLDADSKNELGVKEEGVFYEWKVEELKKLLGSDFNLFKDFYNINDYGFWENDKYVLIRNKSKVTFAKEQKITISELNSKVSKWRKILKNARNKRSKPNLDDKVLTSWNALMAQGYIDAYRAFGDEEFLTAALTNANFLLKHQLKKEYSLYRNFKNGKSTINAYSEDYATVINAFISLYEVTLDEKWLTSAKNLLDHLFVNFFDKKNKMFHFTSKEDENLIARKYEVVDGVIPSSNSIIANSLFKLGHYYSDKNYLETSEQMLNNLKDDVQLNPANYSNWLNLMTNFVKPYYEVVVAGNNSSEVNKELINNYFPNILIAGTALENSTLPLLSYKFNEDKTLIYVCVNGTCKMPETNMKKALENIKK